MPRRKITCIINWGTTFAGALSLTGIDLSIECHGYFLSMQDGFGDECQGGDWGHSVRVCISDRSSGGGGGASKIQVMQITNVLPQQNRWQGSSNGRVGTSSDHG